MYRGLLTRAQIREQARVRGRALREAAALSTRMPVWKVDRARQLAAVPTQGEARLWAALRHLSPPWLRSVPAFGYIFDFYCPSRRLVVEVDGPSHRGREASDLERDAALRRCGLRTFRIDDADVRRDLAESLARILGE